MGNLIGGRALRALVVLFAGILAGCGVAAKINARNDMEMSKAAFKACLSQHPEDIGACEGAREAYEADMAAYRATSAAIRPEAEITVEQPAYSAPPQPPPLPAPPDVQFHPCLPMGPMMTACN